ncbi:Gfo/Idh/MocA family protein [Inmirania thermothiophila]|uniref:Putative dehydrogenase n=1 Tax=Inmirania thermothiophila TaxID=1750597 RepID=A0A3N1Y773_9GAMM|nr:Gfo/Idh/MocA family oxidoreductase [Inmirania thermothiophila]ROR34666.1 putative dehydrogenase [Inmirania thermothiophila]
MHDPIRVGVVGVGYLGSIHARIYARMPQVRLVGVADLDPARARAVAAECGCEAFADGSELLGRVDAVSVVVPTVAHLEVARPFLERGVHMLLEKPIAATLAEAEAVIEAAERGGAILQIGHLERYNAGVMALAERIARPRFIEVHRIGEFVGRATDVDVVTDLMIHDIDIILSLVGEEIASVSAVGSPVITGHVDIANARLEFVNGTVANVTASRVSTKRLRRIRVFSEHGYDALDFIDQQIDSVRTGPARAGGGWPEIRHERIEVAPRPPLDAELEDFLRVVREGGRPLVDGRAGLEALRVAIEVRERIGS